MPSPAEVAREGEPERRTAKPEPRGTRVQRCDALDRPLC